MMTNKKVDNGDMAKTPEGPLKDPLPGHEQANTRTSGGQPPEQVEDRPMVGKVRPEDYPERAG